MTRTIIWFIDSLIMVLVMDTIFKPHILYPKALIYPKALKSKP